MPELSGVHNKSFSNETLNMLGGRMPKHEVFVPVDYSHDLGDSAFEDIDKEGLE